MFAFSILSLSSGGVGNLAAKRNCFSGATTMKMIRSTSSTSISGVTLINGLALSVMRVFAAIGMPPDLIPQIQVGWGRTTAAWLARLDSQEAEKFQRI